MPSVQNVVSQVLNRKPTAPDVFAVVDGQGETALTRYARRWKWTVSDTLPSFIENIRYFLELGFDPYKQNHSGKYPFVYLLEKLPVQDGYNDTYIKFLESILERYPPPRYEYRDPIAFPLETLYDVVKKRYDMEDINVCRYKLLDAIIKMIFTHFDHRLLDRHALVEKIIQSIHHQYHAFSDVIVIDSGLILDEDDYGRILRAFIDDRSIYDPSTIDGKDDYMLKTILKKMKHWENDDDLLTLILEKWDKRAMKIVMSLFTSPRRRDVFFEEILARMKDCKDLKIVGLRNLLKTPVKIRDPDCLRSILRHDCIHHLRLLYDYGALSKNIIVSVLDRSVAENRCTAFLRGLVERDEILSAYQTAQKVRETKILSHLRPDMVRQLSQMLIGSPPRKKLKR